jgi:hypothetical protein
MESIDLPITCRYLRYLINERAEASPYFHDRLAESYLRVVLKTKPGDDGGCPSMSSLRMCSLKRAERGTAYSTLLDFIRKDEYYHVDRLFGLLPSDGEPYMLKLRVSQLIPIG